MKMTDKKIETVIGIPTRTLQDWKKSNKNSWRFKVYNFINKNLISDFVEINERQLQISQRIVALKSVFGNNFESYKFEIFDKIFSQNEELLNIHNNDFFFLKKRVKIMSILEKSNQKKDALIAMELVNRIDQNQYIIFINEFLIWKSKKEKKM